MDDSFLLSNQTAVELYNNFAKDQPIIDYHCHLNPKEIYENKRFTNLTEVWLYGDHYKWRAMRANGIDEEYITGKASDYDKFIAWAKTVPMTIGNPLYNWTHLELQRFFGIDEILNESTAPQIWDTVNQLLNSEGYRVRDLITKSNVEVICTTDDPTDSLEYHQMLQNVGDFNTSVYPSFRPDKGLEINREGYSTWVHKLEEVSGLQITNYRMLLKALQSRVEFFNSLGGKVADHALDDIVFEETTEEEVAVIFEKALNGELVSLEEESKYKTFTLQFLGKLYSDFGWAMQYHISAHRNNNSRMLNRLGPDTGFDSINDGELAKPLCKLLDSLDREDALPKTILYSLNPKDNYVLATLLGSFQGGGVPGKMQLGTAWWFNDQKDGMLDQMKALANLGLLSRFIGMLTDSRSFLSYTRHEYFRRLICDLIGNWVENGEVPNDMELLGEIIQGISYNNAKEYFGFVRSTVSSS